MVDSNCDAHISLIFAVYFITLCFSVNGLYLSLFTCIIRIHIYFYNLETRSVNVPCEDATRSVSKCKESNKQKDTGNKRRRENRKEQASQSGL